MADLFEHYVGNELVYQSQLLSPRIHVKYWRDTAGPEVDYVLDLARHYVPIEVKFSDKPDLYDARHLLKFMEAYPGIEQGYIVCCTPSRYRIAPTIIAIPWQEITSIFNSLSALL